MSTASLQLRYDLGCAGADATVRVDCWSIAARLAVSTAPLLRAVVRRG